MHGELKSFLSMLEKKNHSWNILAAVESLKARLAAKGANG
jgi:hypothetical protein